MAALASERGFLAQIPEASRPSSLGPIARFFRKISSARSPF